MLKGFRAVTRLDQALQWWSNQNHEITIPARHLRVLLNAGMVRLVDDGYCEAHLTKEGEVMLKVKKG